VRFCQYLLYIYYISNAKCCFIVHVLLCYLILCYYSSYIMPKYQEIATLKLAAWLTKHCFDILTSVWFTSQLLFTNIKICDNIFIALSLIQYITIYYVKTHILYYTICFNHAKGSQSKLFRPLFHIMMFLLSNKRKFIVFDVKQLCFRFGFVCVCE